jgi:hypothetical protein
MKAEIKRLINISTKKKKNCAVCQKELEKPTINLPNLPLTEIFLDEKQKEKIGIINQEFHLCDFCGHGQLSIIVDPEVLYGFSYSFQTTKSTSKNANDLFLNFIKKIIKERNFDSIIEIGCNDLYLLNMLKNNANKLIGIDPFLKKKDLYGSDNQISIIPDFFENVQIEKLFESKNNLILSSHNLEHIEAPSLMIEKLLKNASDNDLFIFQFPGLETLVKEYRFDQIFHHHLHYFSLESFEFLINKFGGELIDFDLNTPFWGSLLLAFKKGQNKKAFENKYANIKSENVTKNYDIFKKRMQITNEYIKASDSKLFGYGAVLTLPILAYHLGNDFSKFEAIIDDDKNKEGLYYPNLPVPIIHSSKAQKYLNSSAILITALSSIRQILPKLIQSNANKIINPLIKI